MKIRQLYKNGHFGISYNNQLKKKILQILWVFVGICKKRYLTIKCTLCQDQGVSSYSPAGLLPVLLLLNGYVHSHQVCFSAAARSLQATKPDHFNPPASLTTKIYEVFQISLFSVSVGTTFNIHTTCVFVWLYIYVLIT